MFSDERLRAAGIDPESVDYKYFKGRCEALGINEHTPLLVVEAKLARMIEEATPEAVECDDDDRWCCAPEDPSPPRWNKPSVAETKQASSGYLTPSQQRRMFRK